MRSAVFTTRTETKVIRRTYTIAIFGGVDARAVSEAMNKVPPSAKLVSIDEDHDETHLVFQLETPVENV